MPTAVVTGAGKGIGRAIAERLARDGYAVCASDIDGAAAEQVAAALGPAAWAATLDVRDAEGCRALAREAAERGGGLDVWVGNAGVVFAGAPWDHDDDEITQMVEVNLLGVIRGARAALEAMRPGGRGHIVTIASLAGLIATPGEAVYSASKHGALSFSVGLNSDLRGQGSPIRASAICPDGVTTDMVWDVIDDPAAALVFSGARLVRPEEVADAVARVLEHPRPVTAVPRYRGVLARVMDAFPRLALAGLPLFLRIGRINQRRARKLVPPGRLP